MIFNTILTAVAVLAGGVAAIAGFGIGSLLTPTLATSIPLKLAVALVAIPHFAGTGLRLWTMRSHVDRRVLWTFGIASAAGGLTGALLHSWAASPVLTAVFAILLIFAGVTGVTGLAGRMHFRGWTAWIAGVLSGLFGGLVGNQGGIRSAALFGFNLPRDAFIATATAIALLIDIARLPVYVITEWAGIADHALKVGLMTGGVLVGTLLGRRLLTRIPEGAFRRVVSGLILALGIYMAYLAWRQYGGA